MQVWERVDERGKADKHIYKAILYVLPQRFHAVCLSSCTTTRFAVGRHRLSVRFPRHSPCVWPGAIVCRPLTPKSEVESTA
jgi:hypothetical protein